MNENGSPGTEKKDNKRGAGTEDGRRKEALTEEAMNNGCTFIFKTFKQKQFYSFT